MTMSSQDGEDDDDDDDDDMVIMMTCPVSDFYILFQLFDTDLRY